MITDSQWFEALVSVFAWIREALSSTSFWIGVPVGAVLTGVWLFIARKRYRATVVALNLPFGLGNITYEATDQDRVLAWKMYVQLKTRKAALPFDEENDVIINVFDSLYEMFSITRELLSEAKPHQGEAQKSVTDFLLRVLNDGVRPCLTHWQAIYRVWWDNICAAPENKGQSPQKLQKSFPQYADLVADIKKMNDELTKYAEELLTIVYSKQRRAKLSKRVAITPEPPLQQTGITSPQVTHLSAQKGEECNVPMNKEKP